MMMMMSGYFTQPVTTMTLRCLLTTMILTASFLTSTSLATPVVSRGIPASSPANNDANDISLQSILKPEQQTSTPTYAVGGVDDTYLAEKGRRTAASAESQLWQAVLALLAVSAGAWWVLNTAWFRGLAQQKEAQLLLKKGNVLASPPTMMGSMSSPITTTTATLMPPQAPLLQQAIDWATAVFGLRPEQPITAVPVAEPALARVLQTLPLPTGQFIVMMQVGEMVHSLAVGGHHPPVLVGTWQAAELGLEPAATAVQPEKWMAQTPPTPMALKEAVPNAADLLMTDYEALNATEEALFEQLRQ
jgi:hypothetical protein